MRKMLLALFMVLFMAGLVVAAEGFLTKVDVDKKEATIDDKVYKIDDATKITAKGKDESKDADIKALAKAAERKGKDGKVGTKVTFEAKDTKLTTIEFRGGGKKN
jgi:hypothetical protein